MPEPTAGDNWRHGGREPPGGFSFATGSCIGSHGRGARAQPRRSRPSRIELSGLAIAVRLRRNLQPALRMPMPARRARRDPQVMFVLGATAQLILITAVMTPLTYVAAATICRMQDANLSPIDRALGFDWRALCALRRRASGARRLAELRLYDDPLAALRHSGRAGSDRRASRRRRGIHLRVRRRP